MVMKKPVIDGATRDMLVLAKEQVEDTIRALGETRRELENCRGEAAADIRKDARLLTGAIQFLASESKKIEDSIKEHDGIEGGYAIDLEAARVEIRYRLARLRGAGDTGKLPE